MTEIDQYLIDSHEYFTVEEMADVLGLSEVYVYELCRRLDLRVINPYRQTIEYLRSHQHKTLAQLAKATGWREQKVKYEMCKHRLHPKPEDKVSPLSVRSILSGYRCDDRHHWIEEKTLEL